jgi:hypothetical protein
MHTAGSQLTPRLLYYSVQVIDEESITLMVAAEVARLAVAGDMQYLSRFTVQASVIS